MLPCCKIDPMQACGENYVVCLEFTNVCTLYIRNDLWQGQVY